jgi:hypothetical protein
MLSPTLTIELLSSPGPVHEVTSDEVIFGNVHFTDKIQSPPGILTVTLVGRSETTITKRRLTTTGEATLFQLKKLLHSGPVGDNERKWPFEFIFPATSTGVERQWSRSKPYPFFRTHDLPPSMGFHSVEWIEEMYESRIQEGKGSVVYMIEAEWFELPTSPSIIHSETTSLKLHYVPYGKLEVMKRLIGGGGRRTPDCISLREWQFAIPMKVPKKSIFDKAYAFGINVSVGKFAHLGRPLWIGLGIRHAPQSDGPTDFVYKDAPKFVMTGCTITLIRTINARGKDERKWDHNLEVSTEEVLVKKDDMDEQLDLGHNLGRIMQLGNLETQLGLSFATYNIAQSFRIKVDITLKFRDEIYQHTFDSRGDRMIIRNPLTEEDEKMRSKLQEPRKEKLECIVL